MTEFIEKKVKQLDEWIKENELKESRSTQQIYVHWILILYDFT